MKTSNKGKKEKNIPLKILRTIFLIFAAVAVLAGVAAAGIVFAMIKTAPALDVNQILDLNQTSVIYDSDGKPYDEIITTDEKGDVIKRTVVNYNEIPENLKKAFVSIEDERFISHHGLDYQRLIGVTFNDLKSMITKNKQYIQGGSTITQQLIKNRMFLEESQANRLDIKRKVQEMYLALEIEKKLSKEQILGAYMNTIYLGGTAYGVEAAANQYFNKPAKDLNLVQCAFIAGMAQAPYTYYPFLDKNKKNPDVYLNRTKLVLQQMKKNDPNNTKLYDDAIKQVTDNKIAFSPTVKSTNKYNYEWFSRPVIDQVKQDLKSQYNYTDADIVQLFINGGLKIYSTMDKTLQDKAQDILDNDPMFKLTSSKVQSSAVIMDYHTGEVKVMIGGRFKNNQPANSYNRAYSISSFHRPTGSSIKPITVYGAAIDSKIFTAASIIDDSPLPGNIASKYNDNGKAYQPNNDDFSYSGPITVREAIRRSVNVVAVKIEDALGPANGASYAEKFGITLGKEDKRSSSIAAMALGQLSYGTDTYQMAAAYGVFGNNGIYTSPRLYTKIVDKSGKTILESKYKTSQAISPQAAYVTYDLLKEPVSAGGTGPSAAFSSMARGKTGTATDKKDLWFCGLTPYYSGAVWIGNDDNSKFENLWSDKSAALWGQIMTEFHKNLPEKTLAMPSGIVKSTVCRLSGKLDNGLCALDPKGNTLFSDIFIQGTVPTELCNQHVSVKINKSNGKLATANTPADLIETRVFRKSDLPTESDDTQGNPTPAPTSTAEPTISGVPAVTPTPSP